jgi:hypothetical protein
LAAVGDRFAAEAAGVRFLHVQDFLTGDLL